MALFGDKKSEDEKIQEMFDKFGLDIENYDEERIKQENLKTLKDISRDLAGKGWMKTGMALSMVSADKQATVGYLSAIYNQNLILIRQNELMLRTLKKISEK